MDDAEWRLLSAIARRFYLEDASKTDLATEFSMSRFRVARLLQQAREQGVVTIEIHDRVSYRADLAIDREEERPDQPASARIAEVGDLAEVQARDTVDATGLFVHPADSALAGGPGEPRFLRIGGTASFMITRSVQAGGEPVQRITNGLRNGF